MLPVFNFATVFLISNKIVQFQFKFLQKNQNMYKLKMLGNYLGDCVSKTKVKLF